ncbi:unnamed protein product [[Candida] boidinii]|nr:unnamed protein product [[Candida] boidinii]
MVVVGNNGKLYFSFWTANLAGNGFFLVDKVSSIAATLCLTASSLVNSDSALDLIDLALASKASETSSPEIALAMSTGVCNKEDEVATIILSLPTFSIAELTNSIALAKSAFQMFLPSMTPTDKVCSPDKIEATSSNCSGHLTKSKWKPATGKPLIASMFGLTSPK